MITSQSRTGNSPALAIEAQALVKTYPKNVRALDGLLAPFPCASRTAYVPCEDCDIDRCSVR